MQCQARPEKQNGRRRVHARPVKRELSVQ
jgi:hypothetical protein